VVALGATPMLTVLEFPMYMTLFGIRRVSGRICPAVKTRFLVVSIVGDRVAGTQPLRSSKCVPL